MVRAVRSAVTASKSCRVNATSITRPSSSTRATVRSPADSSSFAVRAVIFTAALAAGLAAMTAALPSIQSANARS